MYGKMATLFVKVPLRSGNSLKLVFLCKDCVSSFVLSRNLAAMQCVPDSLPGFPRFSDRQKLKNPNCLSDNRY